MSVLAAAVVAKLAKRQRERRLQLTVAEVDQILEDLGIPTAAVRGVPVPLRATRVSFRGTKTLGPHLADSTEDADAESGQEVAAGNSDERRAPFSFEWQPQLGVNGIGSGRNLRGKSTVVNVLMWSLTGRCGRLQPDVRRWIERVEVDWQVGAERLRVSFDADDGVATGSVDQLPGSGESGGSLTLARFDNASFEGVVGSLIMARLRLEDIPVWADSGKRVHAWPSYASAMVVRADQLDPIIGHEQTLAIRMMQMFLGSDWAPALAAAATERRSMDAARTTAAESSRTASEAAAAKREQAQALVDDLQVKVRALSATVPDLDAVMAPAARASDLARQAHALEGMLLAQEAIAETAQEELRSAKARRHTAEEHALATKFFHRMQPTVCPRCTAQVTPERRAAEPGRHECSVCSSDLNLDALEADVIVASSVPAEVAATLIVSAAAASGIEQEEGGRDDVAAAEAAVNAAAEALTGLASRLKQLQLDRDRAAAEADACGQRLAEASERRDLELELARAEGALSALATVDDRAPAGPVDPTRFAVADAAMEVLQSWVKNGQDPLLLEISKDIQQYAASFGADNLTHVHLDGAANMRISKGGATLSYSGLTPGEKLRVKIATAVALIKRGFAENTGRHPGLLVLDSPAAEEIPESDLAVILNALQTITAEAQIQIFVATRYAGPLIEILPSGNRRVAIGEEYLW